MADAPTFKHWDGPGLDAWRAWTPAQVTQRLRTTDACWCVVGGWAIDLFIGHQTRPHGDLEIAVPRVHFPTLRAALAGFLFHSVGDGEVRLLAARSEPPADKHQNWVLDPAEQAWRVDVMLEPGDTETWVYRRDERISAPRPFMVGRTPDGIPFLQPHGVLLYKAKASRPKDEDDLVSCLARITEPSRAWLTAALTETHPGHPWLARLEESPTT